MSSRAGMIGSGSSSGNYKPSPTPTEQESMPTYINDELLTVGGIVNGILEGGAFPPQGKMPVRWREGMMMYFIEPLEDTYITGAYRGQKIITSAGIWLYRRERWWKIIDDPSSIAGAVFAYRLTSDGTQPSTPAPSSAPPSGWSSTAPTKNDKSEWIWVTMSSAYDDNTDEHTWSQPTIFSAGVIDGVDGVDGAPGEPGEPGLDGTNGENGYRGTVVLTDTVARTSWSNTAAYNLVVNTVSGDVDAKNRVPLQGDVVTQQSSAAGFVETRRYVGNSGNPGTWQVVDLVIDGNAVVTGTLNGNALIANTQIRIGGNSGQDVVVLDANDSDARIYVGASNGSNARNTAFAVTPDGTLYANNGYFGGTVTAEGLTGAIGSKTGSLTGLQWLLYNGSSRPIVTLATLTVPIQNYDRTAQIVFTPAHLRKAVHANDDRFGVRYTSLQGTGVNPSYRLSPENDSGTYWTMYGNTYGSLDFLGSNSDNSIYSITNSITWSVNIPASTNTGNMTIPIKVALDQPSLTYPISIPAPFTMDTGTINVTISKDDTGIIMN